MTPLRLPRSRTKGSSLQALSLSLNGLPVAGLRCEAVSGMEISPLLDGQLHDAMPSPHGGARG